VRLFVNTDNGKLINGLTFPEPIADNRIEVKRADSKALDFYFGTPFSANSTDLGSVTTFKFGAKVAGDYAGSYVASNYNGSIFSFTETTSGSDTYYRVSPGWNSTKLNNLLGNDPEGFAEVTEIRTVADVATSLTGKYFVLRDSAGSVGVWIDVNNAGTSAPAGATACTRQIEITTITTGMSASAVATAIATVLEADSAFTASASGSLITVTDATIGPRTAAADGSTGFTVSRWITGASPNTMTNVEYVDLDAEVEWVVGGLTTSTVTFTVRAFSDLNQGSEGVPVDSTPAYPAPGLIPLWLVNITSLTGGGATALDSLATASGLYNDKLVIIFNGGAAKFYTLVSGTDAEASPTVIRPDDYASSTNEKVWKLIA